ncbi:hypothetical protein [Kitasatospora sp. NPDC088351]|uniref:hypothetical protein n=1 Tax=unclassified Kitasatospora TaxID=2633591 RepID=UPI003417C0E9
MRDSVDLFSGTPDEVPPQVIVTDPDQRLRTALDALDAAFAPFSDQPFDVGGCAYCYPDAGLAALAGPARLVPEELIPSVSAKSIGHWDDGPGLYRKMTPRIVRALATGRLHVDHGLIASRLLEAGWRDWPGPEREALDAVWSAWWRATLHRHPGVAPVTGVLETIAVSTGSLAPWLGIWAATRTEAAERHLSDAMAGWLSYGQLSGLRLGFYDELDATAELLPWLLSLGEDRIGAAQLYEVEKIAYS